MQSNFKSTVVWLILNGNMEKALDLLVKEYKIRKPKIRVGLPKGHKKNTLGCYIIKKSTITVYNREILTNPYVILHEFYHHLRTNVDKKHKGTEKNANKFASDFIKQYTKNGEKQLRTLYKT